MQADGRAGGWAGGSVVAKHASERACSHLFAPAFLVPPWAMQLEDALEIQKFGDDHRDVARWLKEKRDLVGLGEAVVDAAAAEAAVKKLEDQVRLKTSLRAAASRLTNLGLGITMGRRPPAQRGHRARHAGASGGDGRRDAHLQGASAVGRHPNQGGRPRCGPAGPHRRLYRAPQGGKHRETLRQTIQTCAPQRPELTAPFHGRSMTMV